MDDFLPTADLETLRRRAALLKKLRSFFDDRGFFEVETPLLSADVVVDRFLDPIAVKLLHDSRDAAGRSMYLQTSPEFGMKRLLAAGAEAIYQVAKAFRAGEVGDLHNVEFTIVEWYRAGDDMAAGIALLGELAEAMLARGQPQTVAYRDAFLEHAKLDPFRRSTDEIIALAEERAGFRRRRLAGDDVPETERDEALNCLLAACVEPQLGRGRPTILCDFPPTQAALAVVRDDDPPVAERFELYVEGVELANGYHELRDADELLRRNSANNAIRVADGKKPLPENSRLISAMRHGLPPCSGVALGFDRLAMIALGKSSLREVMAFLIDRA